MFWHIDYLLRALPVHQAMTFVGAGADECKLVQELLMLPGSSAPVVGFGSSDCRRGCPAHLVRVAAADALAPLKAYGGILLTYRPSSEAGAAGIVTSVR